MPGTIYEKYISNRGTDGDRSQREKQYVIIGAADDDEAATLLATTAPATHRGQPLVDLDYDEIVGNDGAYEGRAIYGTPGFADLTTDPDGISFAFDTTGGTTHIRQGLQNIGKYGVAEGGTAPNNFGAVVVDSEGKVAGADIISPVFNWTETKIYDAAEITPEFMRNLFLLTGKVNSADTVSSKMGTLFAGECLFKGATGSSSSADEVTITYSFGGSPNREDVEVEVVTSLSPITVATVEIPLVKGWYLLWPCFASRHDDASKLWAAYPRYHSVDRVYEEADLSDLDIFTAPPPPEP